MTSGNPPQEHTEQAAIPIGTYNLFQHEFLFTWNFAADTTHCFDITLAPGGQVLGSFMVMPAGPVAATFDHSVKAKAERLCGPLLLPTITQACQELAQALRDRAPVQTEFLFTPAGECPQSLLPR